jgi:hypothetical protein
MTVFRRYLPSVPALEGARETGILALRPPYVTGMTQPIVDGDGGISIAVVTDHIDGVQSLIAPWLGMLAGDTVEAFLDSDKVYSHVVTEDDVDQSLFFFIDAQRFTPGWIDQYYYLLHRVGEVLPDDPSIALRLKVKLNRPGGRDEDPHLPGHSRLKMVQLPEEVIQHGVDAEWAAKGVPMNILRYPEIALRDTIQVKWGSAFLTPFVLTQAHVDGTEPIVIQATQADILAGGDSAKLLVQYEVYDEVWNYSEKWSIPTTVRVDAGAWRLEAPIIRESVNGIIDIKELNQLPVTVQIHLRTEDFQRGDTIIMTWIGTPQTGKQLINIQTVIIDNVPGILELLIPYEEVRSLARGSADASYVLTKSNGSPPLSSKRAFANVVGDVYAHPAPVIREVVGDILNPDTSMATVDVAYPGIANGDVIDLIWEGKRSNGSPYVHEEQYTVSRNDAERKSVTMYVQSEHITILANGLLNLWYRVFNDDVDIYGISESEHLLLNVRAIPATLPAPKVPEAPDGVLDPAKIFEKVIVLVDYLGTVKGDILTYYWTSPNPFTSTSDWVSITTLNAGRPAQFRVDAAFVSANIGDYVKVRYTLKHANTARYSYSATFDVLIGYLVGELPAPQVVQAPDARLDPIKVLDGVDIEVSYASMDPTLDIIGLKWLGTPGSGSSEDQEKPGDASRKVLFHLLPSFVGANINRMVSVGYDVNRYGHKNPSETLALMVLGFQEPETQLPRPQVPQSVAGVLDLMEFAGNPEVVVATWPFTATGQRVWLRLEGKTIAGDSLAIVLLEGAAINADQVSNGLKETLVRSELLKLAHASLSTVICRVTFDGAPSESSAIEFPSLQLTVRTRYDYVTPVITRMLDTRGNVENGGKTRDDEVTVEGTGTRGETIELFDALTQSMGTATVGVDRNWSRKIGKLTEKTYRITAKALYDAEPISSEAWSFTVAFAITPLIRSLTDTKGVLAPGAITYDNSVLVEGDASAGEKIQLLDGATPIITLDVLQDGSWSHRYNELTVKSYNLVAMALYDIEPVASAPYPFVVAQTVTPAISTVTDAKGNVANGATTHYRSLKLEGIASKDEDIELRDGAVMLKIIEVDSNGNWNWTLNDLALKAYSLTAKGLYGSEPVSAPPRTFIVAAHLSPIISTVNDSRGVIAPGEVTYDNSVLVEGDASAREKIQLLDGATPIITLDVLQDGSWSHRYDGLTVKSYNLIAKALYEVEPVASAPYPFVVAQSVSPTISTVTDAKGNVANGATTYYRSLTLAGKASKDEDIELRDGTTILKIIEVDSNGNWNWTLNDLALKAYSLTAKGLYGSEPVSAPPRTFIVAAHLSPIISTVNDSRGVIEPGEVTYDKSVLVRGNASAREKIQLLDGATPIITLDVLQDGSWSHRYDGLTVKSYNLVAKALYEVEPVASAPYPFVVAQAVAPTISTVTDAKGNVANGATTYYRSLTLAGKASKDEDIELRDGIVMLKIIRVGHDGNWNWTLNNLALKAYSLTAKGLYGSEPVSTPPRTFIVAAPFPPTISALNDSKGVVANNGTTYDTAVTATGEAPSQEQVQLYNNGSPVGSPVTSGANRQWSVRISGLSVRAHSLIARALYSVVPVDSAPRNFTVAALVPARIDSVRDAIGEVQNDGQTKSTSVTVQGVVTSGQQVQILDNGVSRLTVTALGTSWSTPLTVALGGHSITARAVTTGQVSNTRSFTVISPIPALVINTAHVSLSGWIFRSDHTPTNPPAGSFIVRTASGGVPPYQYTSSNSAAAEVNASTGRVISKGNGSAVITVRDSAGQSAAYPVGVSNVFRIFGTHVFNTYTQCHNAAVSQGGRSHRWQSGAPTSTPMPE